MTFDDQGHLIVSPKEIQEGAFTNPGELINKVLIPGTPLAVPTHDQHCRLLDYLAAHLAVHPRNFLMKGSTKIGFSIAPKPEKVWMEYGPESDLDLAVIDEHCFHTVDHRVQQWERDPANRGRMFQNVRLLEAHKNRNNQKGRFDCFRFFDLPPIPFLEELNRVLDQAPLLECCGIRRGIRAFIFRDWWAIYRRYDYDLHCLRKGLRQKENPLPGAGDTPRPHVELVE